MTDGTGEDRIVLSLAEARALGESAMRGAGYDEEEARILTDHVLDAALCGYEYSGLPKLLNVVDAPLFRRQRRPVTVLRETGATAIIDGGNNTGMLAAYRAAQAAIERAEAKGLAIVCLANTWMTGRSAYYCEMIARAGMVAIHTVAASPAVAPFGGARPALGTNPIAFGFPTEADPLVIDMGTSAFMGTDLLFRARRHATCRKVPHSGRTDGRQPTPAPREKVRCFPSAAQRAVTRASALRSRWMRSAR